MPVREAIQACMLSNRDEYETPQKFWEGLDNEFDFTLDAAASAANAKCQPFFSKHANALDAEWYGRVWCNPPYGRMWPRFVSHAMEQAYSSVDTIVVMLLAARTDTKAWHDYIMKATERRFVRGRLTFEVDGKPLKTFNKKKNKFEITPAPFPSVVVVFDRPPAPGFTTIRSIDNKTGLILP